MQPHSGESRAAAAAAFKPKNSKSLGRCGPVRVPYRQMGPVRLHLTALVSLSHAPRDQPNWPVLRQHDALEIIKTEPADMSEHFLH